MTVPAPPRPAGIQVKLRETYVPPPPDPSAAPTLSVVVPARDAAPILRRSIASLTAALEAAGATFEILLVDDGSRDGTPREVEAIAAADPRVRPARHDVPRGSGAALRTGAAAARGAYVGLCFPEAPLAAEDVTAFLDLMESRASYSYFPGRPAADVAVGFRRRRPGLAAWRRAAGWIGRWGVRLALRLWVRDPAWVFLARREVLDAIPVRGDGLAAIPVLLAAARRAGMEVRQLPIPMRPVEGAEGRRLRSRAGLRDAFDVARAALRPARPDGVTAAAARRGPPA